jgi:hypothetical protein
MRLIGSFHTITTHGWSSAVSSSTFDSITGVVDVDIAQQCAVILRARRPLRFLLTPRATRRWRFPRRIPRWLGAFPVG